MCLFYGNFVERRGTGGEQEEGRRKGADDKNKRIGLRRRGIKGIREAGISIRHAHARMHKNGMRLYG